jgi:hypothetical protein
MLFGQFVGSWDVDLTDFGADGSRRRRRGEWHFDWVLGGVAVQDVLFEHGAPAAARGTTLRAYDPAIDAWRVTWMSPGGGEFANLVARASGDEIVLEGTDSTGRDVRWSFCQITPDAFVWRGEASSDGGCTWWLEQEMRARRVAAESYAGEL